MTSERSKIMDGLIAQDADLVDDDFAPIWEESILLAEHEAVQASVDVGGWLSAALDDPNVCEQMKADINRWFSSGFLYLNSVRQLMQADREAVRAEVVGEIVAWLADHDFGDYYINEASLDIADEIEAKF